MPELCYPSVNQKAAFVGLVLFLSHPSKPGTAVLGTSRWPVLIDLATMTAFLEVLAASFRRLAYLRNGGPAATGRTSAACSGHLKTRLYLFLPAGGEKAIHGHQLNSRHTTVPSASIPEAPPIGRMHNTTSSRVPSMAAPNSKALSSSAAVPPPF